MSISMSNPGSRTVTAGSGTDLHPDLILQELEDQPHSISPTTEDSCKHRLLIVGYGRHGKDTMADILEEITGLRYGGSTSWAALPFIARTLGMHPQKVWESRHANRQFWFDFCNVLRKNDPLFLVRRVLKQGDLVVGIRDKEELDCCRASGWFKRIIWVDALSRIPEGDATVKFKPADCDEIIFNNTTRAEFVQRILLLCQRLDLPIRSSYLPR
jgi:hypothetical protein